MDELLAAFIAETRETLDKISGDLVAWEADPADRIRLDEVFRFIHTVKGSCGFLDLPRLEKLSHAAEEALQRFRGNDGRASREQVSAVLAVVDRIGLLVDRLENGEDISAGSDEAILRALSGGAAPTDGAPARTTGRTSAAALQASSRSIRVPVALLDQLMGGVSDLVLARNELSRRLRSVDPDPPLEAAFERLSQRIADIRDGVTWTRMQRIESLFAAVPRLVRDLADQLDKQVSLRIEGEDVELDREMIEMLRDPLIHLVRNALDHGIESPRAREKAGKPASGTLELSARQSGNDIEITIRDDGAGIDRHRLVDKAAAAGIFGDGPRPAPDSPAALELVFHPGLSTADEAGTISGRGVGMDAVRANIEKIGGSIDIASEPGGGTGFTLSVPLTLTIIPALVVSVGEHFFAIPRLAIEEIVGTNKDSVRLEKVGASETAVIRGSRLSLVRAGELIGLEDAKGGAGDGIVVILAAGRERRFALLVSGIFAGTALPDDGRPLLLLDAAGIAARAGLRWTAGADAARKPSADAAGDAAFAALAFDDFDGRRRAISLAVVDRILELAAGDIAESADLTRARIGDRLVPLVTGGALPSAGAFRAIRLSDGDLDCVYAIAGNCDSIAFPADFERSRTPGRIAGIGVVDGEPVELLDPHALLAEIAHPRASRASKRCRIVAADPNWVSAILAPLVELAGYEIVADEDVPVDLLILADENAEPDAEAAETLRLSSAPDGSPDRLYRYDRSGIFEALQQKRKAGGTAL